MVAEAEWPDLQVALRGLRSVTSELTATELRRAVGRRPPLPLRRADQVLATLALLPLDRPLVESAGVLAPPVLRSLDALHLATALRLGAGLDRMVTYDRRLAQAAAAAGLAVESPGAS